VPTALKGKRSHSFASDSEVIETFGSRRRIQDIMNNVRSQARAQLYAFDPVEFKLTPVSTRVCEAPVNSTALLPEKALNTNCMSDSEAQARSTDGDKQNSYHTVDSEIQIRARPRQPNSLSSVDPEAPTRTFGSNGQRQVTVLHCPTGLPQALVSSSDRQWSWKSIDQLDQAIGELVNEGNLNFQQSTNVTGSRSVPYQTISGGAGSECDSQIELTRGKSSTSSSSQASFSAINLELEGVNEQSQLAVNWSECGDAADLPVQLPSSVDLFRHVDNQQSRPVCYSAPPLEQRDDVSQPVRRRLDTSMADGAACVPPAAASVGGRPLIDLQTGQHVTGQFCNRDGVRHGQRDSNNVVVQGVASAVAPPAVDTRRIDCFTGGLGDEQVRVCYHSGHDVESQANVDETMEVEELITRTPRQRRPPAHLGEYICRRVCHSPQGRRSAIVSRSSS